MAYINKCVSKHSKEELAWAIDKYLRVISNKMSVIPLKNTALNNIVCVAMWPLVMCFN